MCRVASRAKNAWTAGFNCETILRSKRFIQDVMLSCLPDFLHAELERVAGAVFFKENRMEHARSPISTGNPASAVKGFLVNPRFVIRALRSGRVYC